MAAEQNNERSGLSPLEETSDRFNFNPEARPSQIPIKAIKRLKFFRSLGELPEPPNPVIVNTHAELAIDIDNKTDLINIVPTLSVLSLTDNSPILFEPLLRTLDIYRMDKQNHFTTRLRFYVQDGATLSTRIILADTEPDTPTSWKSEGFEVPTRFERVYVLRKDDHNQPRETVKTIMHNAKKFLKEESRTAAVVYKALNRANFGKTTMWDHRPAIYNNRQGVKINATETLGVIGMGPYLNLSIQEIQKLQPQQPLSNEKVLAVIKTLIQTSDPLAAYNKIARSEKSELRMEIEAKGEDFAREAAHIAENILGDDGIFASNGIPFTISHKRKVNT